MHILLVEDDPLLGQGIATYLELQGAQVTWLQEARALNTALAHGTYDTVLLDLMLPDGDGLQVCQYLSQRHPELPILMLTAKTDEDSALRGLAAGARDYLRKPFGNRELLARIQVHLPRKRADTLELGALQLRLSTRQATYSDQVLRLNRRQFDLLSCLLQHQTQVLSRDQLLDHLKMDWDVTDRTIDSHISQLRGLLRRAGAADIQIVSVYGLGYRLSLNPTADQASA